MRRKRMRSLPCCARRYWPARTGTPAPTIGLPPLRVLLPETDAILARCEAHAAFAGNNYLPLLRRFYGGQRAAFLRFLAHAAPVSTSQDRATAEAIAFLLAHRTDRRAKLHTVVEVVGADGGAVRQPLDLSF